MILDLDKFEQLIEKKKEVYSNYTSEMFFKNNNQTSPCEMGERATILYHLIQKQVAFTQSDFTDEDRKQVEEFVKCLEAQMNKVISGELNPVDLTEQEILNLVRISDDEIKECFMSKEDILKMMEEMKNG